MAHSPIISRQNSDSGRVITFLLHSETLSTHELVKFADKKIRPQLTRINGIAAVDIWGLSNNIEIAVDPLLLRAYKNPFGNGHCKNQTT